MTEPITLLYFWPTAEPLLLNQPPLIKSSTLTAELPTPTTRPKPKQSAARLLLFWLIVTIIYILVSIINLRPYILILRTLWSPPDKPLFPNIGMVRPGQL